MKAFHISNEKTFYKRFTKYFDVVWKFSKSQLFRPQKQLKTIGFRFVKCSKPDITGRCVAVV